MLSRGTRILKDEAARKRRRNIKHMMIEKLDRYYAKLHRLKKKRRKHEHT